MSSSPLVSSATLAAAPSAVPARGGRLDYIDSLRGIAALLVIWLHASEVFVRIVPSGAWVYDSSWAINSGRVGVVLFFAISGFVIPSSLRTSPALDRAAALRGFAIHRFLRLYPAYWMSVIAIGVLAWTAVTPPLPVATALVNLTMIQGMLGYPDAIGLYWTLRIELVFYTLCGVLFALGLLHRPAWLAAGVGAGLAGYFGGHLLRSTIVPPAGWSDQYAQLPLYSLFVSFMFWGALVRRWHDGRLAVDRSLGGATLVLFPVFVCTVPLLLAMINVLRPVPMFETVGHALGIGAFVLGVTCCRMRGRIGPWLGEISYSLYLFHPVVMYLLFALTARGQLRAFGPHVGTYVLLTMAVTIAVSAAMFYAIERPAIRLGRRLAPGKLAVQAAP